MARSTFIPDPLLYVERLFRMIGVTIRVGQPIESDADNTDLEVPPEPPWLHGNPHYHKARLAWHANGQVRNRSEALFGLAMHLAEAAVVEGEYFDESTLAGLIKGRDEAEKNYHTYTGRPDASHQYRTIAQKALNKLQANQSVEAKKPQPKRAKPKTKRKKKSTDDGSFIEDVHDDPTVIPDRHADFVSRPDGLWYVGAGTDEDKAKHVANFTPRVVEEIRIDRGDDRYQTLFTLELTHRDGGTVTAMARVEDLNDGLSARRWVARNAGTDYAFQRGMADYLWQAIHTFAQQRPPKKTKVFTYTGWIEYGGRPAFLFPSGEGAIGPDGTIPNLRAGLSYLTELKEEHFVAPVRVLENYGVHVRPPTTKRERADAVESLYDLLRCAPPSVMVPLVLHILSTPLQSASESRFALHLQGQTASRKTTLVAAAASLFGNFHATTMPMVWDNVTEPALYSVLNIGKDLPILIDDYKTSHFRKDPMFPKSVLQHHADGTGPVKMGKEGQVTLRGVLVSNGEDRPDAGDSASVLARMLIVRLANGVTDSVLLKRVRDEHRLEGRMGLLTGAWLQWLAERPDWPSLFKERYDQRMSSIVDWTRITSAHDRIYHNLSSLLACADLFLECLKELTGPKRYQAIRQLIGEGVVALVAEMRSTQEEIKQLAPLQILIDSVRDGMADGRARLMPYNGNAHGRWPWPNDNPRAATIGWYEGTYTKGNLRGLKAVYFIRGVTFDNWYRNEQRRAGDREQMVWPALWDDPRVTRVTRRLAGAGPRKVMRVPIEVFLGEEVS